MKTSYDDEPLYPPSAAERGEKAVITLARTAVCQLRSLIYDDGTTPAQIAALDFNGDRNLGWLVRSAMPLNERRSGWLVKGSVNVTTTASIPPLLQTLTADYLASLTGVAAAPDVIARTLQLRFGRNASISVPAFITSASKSGYVKEGQPIPVQPQVLGSSVLDLAALKTISTVTEEMIISPNVEALVKDVMRQNTFLAVDSTFFDANPAVAQTRPAGIRHNIAALTASADTDAGKAMVADIRTLVGAVAPVAGNEPIILVANPVRARTMPFISSQTDLSSLIVLPSDAVAAGDLIAIAPRAIVSATDDTPEIATSKETLLHMDTAPQHIGTSGTPPVVATPSVSMWQSGNVALRLVMAVSWQRRDDRAVSWLTTTKW